jgi:putative membrane protein
MKPTVIAISCLLFVVPVSAVAQSASEGTGAQNTSISRKTQDFVNQVAVSDMFEAASAKLAQANGNEADKQFANKMIDDHMKTSSELKRIVLAVSSKAEMPTQLDVAHQRKLDELDNARGQDFSSTYAAQQVEAHKEAVSLFEQYANGGDQPDLKTWAAQTLPALKHHLEMAQQIADPKSPTVGSSTSR